MTMQLLIEYVNDDPILHHLQCNGLNQSQLNLALAHYDKVIDDLSQSTEKGHRKLSATALVKRAIINNMRGDMHSSLQDANTALDFAPRSLEAYLCAGEALATMKKHSKSIRIYDTALRKVPTSHPKYHKLVNLRRATADQINMLLLNALPIEVLNSIFTELITAQDRTQCSMTCRSWRQLVLDSLPAMWNELTFGDTSAVIMTRIVTHARSDRVRKVIFEFDDDEYDTSEASLKAALSLLLEYQYKKIECLEFRSIIHDASPHTHRTLFQFLIQNKDSLKNVIVYKNVSPRIVADILTMCPNITHLTSTSDPPVASEPVTELRQGDYGSLITAQREKLRIMGEMLVQYKVRLYDEYVSRSIIVGDLQHISTHDSLVQLEVVSLPLTFFRESFWQKLPNLQHLIIGDPRAPALMLDIPSELIPAIDTHCPKLRTLRCGYHFRDKRFQSTNDDENPGLVEITIRPMRMMMHTMRGLGLLRIGGLIQKSSNMLQVLHLPINTFNLGVVDILTAPTLREIGLYSDSTDEVTNNDSIFKTEQASALVRQCPSLETVILTAPTSGETLLELSKAQKLQRICLMNSTELPLRFEGAPNSAGQRCISHSFEPFTSVQLLAENYMSLTEVCFRGPFVTDHSLHAIVANNKRLTAITLVRCDDLTSHGLISAVTLCSPKSLQRLTLMDLPCLDGSGFQQLIAQLPNHIEHITLAAFPGNMNDPSFIRTCLQKGMESKKSVQLIVQLLLEDRRETRIQFVCKLGRKLLEKRDTQSFAVIRSILADASIV